MFTESTLLADAINLPKSGSIQQQQQLQQQQQQQQQQETQKIEMKCTTQSCIKPINLMSMYFSLRKKYSTNIMDIQNDRSDQWFSTFWASSPGKRQIFKLLSNFLRYCVP